jgi:hypothetical protein
MDRTDHGSALGDPVYGAAPGDRRCGASRLAARRDDRDGLPHDSGLRCGRAAAAAVGDLHRLCPHRLRLDAYGAADRWLCAEGRGALRSEIRAAAAVGLGCVRGGRAGLRSAGGGDRRPASDLGNRGNGRTGRYLQPRSAADRRAKSEAASAGQRGRLAARTRISDHHGRCRADPGQPRGLLYRSLDRMAGVRPGRPVHRGTLVAGRRGGNCGVRAVAAVFAVAGAAGGAAASPR